MVCRWVTKNRSYWKEIFSNIIYYHSDRHGHSLMIQNIGLSKIINYPEINPKSIEFIYKAQSSLLIVIQNQNFLQYAKLEVDTLKIKKINKIFYKNLFYNPKPQYHHRVYYMFQRKRIVVVQKNKLIRNFKGEIRKILPEQLLIKMTVYSYDYLNEYQIGSVMNKIQTKFEQLLKIQICKINENGTFKRIGDFIILKQQEKLKKKQQKQTLTFYMELSLLNQTGQYGSIKLKQKEKLKQIKVINNNLYLLTVTQEYLSIYMLYDKKRYLVFQNSYSQEFEKKPTFNLNYLLLTNRINPASEPLIEKFDLINY